MNWFQRVVARVVLGRERAEHIALMDAMGCYWIGDGRTASTFAGEDIREGQAVYMGSTGMIYVDPSEPVPAAVEPVAPASVHFHPTMSVDDMPKPQWPITSHAWSRLVPLSSDCFPWERDTSQIQHGLEAKCYEVRADGSMREVPEAEAQAHFHAHVCRPRLNMADPTPIVGDMGPHMPYDWP